MANAMLNAWISAEIMWREPGCLGLTGNAPTDADVPKAAGICGNNKQNAAIRNEHQIEL